MPRYFPLKAHDPRSARPPKAYKTDKNDERFHRAQSRRKSRAAITVVRRMVINVQRYVRRGPCVPVRGDDRLLPLGELPYVTGRCIVTAEVRANADHVS